MQAIERRFRYGLDAPSVLVISTMAGVALVVVGLTVAPFAFDVGVVSLLYSAVHLWASSAGKVRRARRLLDELPWRGDEVVLDVGCGHGLLLIEAARHLRTGQAIGVDVWSQKDQWRNSREATIENARWAGVADRVEVRDADARELPFPDATFDAVVSSLVIHNIPGREQRARAIREIARVLKPGGRVAIIDLARTSEYASTLTQAGLVDVRRSRPGLLFVPTARKVTARRAA